MGVGDGFPNISLVLLEHRYNAINSLETLRILPSLTSGPLSIHINIDWLLPHGQLVTGPFRALQLRDDLGRLVRNLKIHSS